MKILEKPTNLIWEYDEEADVLCVSMGEPRPAVDMDIGEGVVIHYGEARREVVGLNLIGLRARMKNNLSPIN